MYPSYLGVFALSFSSSPPAHATCIPLYPSAAFLQSPPAHISAPPPSISNPPPPTLLIHPEKAVVDILYFSYLGSPIILARLSCFLTFQFLNPHRQCLQGRYSSTYLSPLLDAVPSTYLCPLSSPSLLLSHKVQYPSTYLFCCLPSICLCCGKAASCSLRAVPSHCSVADAGETHCFLLHAGHLPALSPSRLSPSSPLSRRMLDAQPASSVSSECVHVFVCVRLCVSLVSVCCRVCGGFLPGLLGTYVYF